MMRPHPRYRSEQPSTSPAASSSAVESANALVRVELPGEQAEPQIITGTVPHDATEAPNGTVFVANEHGGTVTVLREDQIVKVFTDQRRRSVGFHAATDAQTGRERDASRRAVRHRP
jgi:hypothetical protein